MPSVVLHDVGPRADDDIQAHAGSWSKKALLKGGYGRQITHALFHLMPTLWDGGYSVETRLLEQNQPAFPLVFWCGNIEMPACINTGFGKIVRLCIKLIGHIASPAQ